MRRRTLLAALPAALLTGCSQPSETTPTTEKSTTPTTATPTTTTPTSTSVAPETIFGFDVAVVQETPTTEHPPVVQISVVNQRDSTHVLTIPNHSFPFASPEGTGDDASLILSAEIPSARDGDCWTGTWKVLPMIDGHRFTPGDAVSRTYAVLNAESSGTCWQPGQYEFTQTAYLDPNNPYTTDGGTEFDWGFTIQIHDDTTISVAEIQTPEQTSTNG